MKYFGQPTTISTDYIGKDGHNYDLLAIFKGYGYRLSIIDFDHKDDVDGMGVTVFTKFFHSTDATYAMNYLRKVARTSF